MHTQNPEYLDNQRKGNKLFLVIMAVCLGGITLGLGLGAGYVITRHFLPEAEAASTGVDSQEATITTVRLNPLVVPIDTQEPNFVEIIPEAKAAVVRIAVTAPTTRSVRGEVPGAGSGFIFTMDDDYVFIATNNHVVENTTTISVSLNDTENIPARIVGYDRASDVAVIAASRAEMEEKSIPFALARLGDSDNLRMGDAVIAIGNAMGEGQTVTRGIISALSLNIEIPDTRNRLSLYVLQTDAAVNRGNSGGPLINQYGEVIGIVTAKLIGTDIEGMGYALPINNVYPLLMDIMETGSVRRTYIGLSEPQEISELFRGLFNLPSTGILVHGIVENSPGYLAGLQRGDLIVQFGTRRITGNADLVAALEASRPGDEVLLHIYRENIRMEIPIVLGSRMS
jgi:serine protease Do